MLLVLWAELVAEKLQPELVDWNDYPDWKWLTNCRMATRITPLRSTYTGHCLLGG